MSKSIVFILILLLVITFPTDVVSQCSLCTKTAQQLGDKPAKGMNAGIIYLMLMPLAIVGFIAFRWWRNSRLTNNL